MAQPPLHLIIGNYNTSSWSLRAWLTLRLARLAFIETRIPLRRPETAERIGQHSPSGKLPVLLAEGVPIWDSLAIAEFIAELEPGIWPLDPIARAEARAISAELHSGFADLRRLMPMDVVNRFAPPGRLPRDLSADIRRLMSIWEHCRARFDAQGPFLFGAFSIVDAMMAPIATRFVTHGVPLAGAVEDYVDSVMAWPDMVTWCDAAAAEQSEREATGSLAVATVTRPGRVLGAEPSDAPAETPPSEAPSAAEAAAAQAVAAVAEGGRVLAAEHDDATARPHAAEMSPDAMAEPAPPPRKRLFEKSPISPADDPAPADAARPLDGQRPLDGPVPLDAPTTAASIAPATLEQSPKAEVAAEDRLGAESERIPSPARKLGWLRHAVPADHFGDTGADEGETGPRRRTEERSSTPESGRPPESPRSSPANQASGNQAARPTAIKPIGGGILRRR